MACPAITDLVKDPSNQTWSTKDGNWKSFAPSFSDQITGFLGAQWQGVNVGTIACVYSGSDKIDTNNLAFPIILQYNSLVSIANNTPNNAHNKWSKNLGGYANCKSTDTTGCLFIPIRQASPVDIYQQASQLKTTPQSERVIN